MKQTSLFLLLLIFLFSCNTTHEPDREKLLQTARTYVQSKLNKGVKLDSCYITGVDTFTALKEAQIYFTVKSDSARALNHLAEAMIKKINADAEVIRLSYKISKDLGDMEKRNALTDTTEIHHILNTSTILAAEMDSLNKMMQQGRFDSVQLLDYRTALQVCLSDSAGKQVCTPIKLLITKDYKIDGKYNQ